MIFMLGWFSGKSDIIKRERVVVSRLFKLKRDRLVLHEHSLKV